MPNQEQPISLISVAKQTFLRDEAGEIQSFLRIHILFSANSNRLVLL